MYILQNIDEIYAETSRIYREQSVFERESQLMSRITRVLWILTKGKYYWRGRRRGRGSLPVSIIYEHEKKRARCTEKVQRDFRSRNPIFKKKSFISDRAFSRLVSVDLTYRLSYVLRLIYRLSKLNWLKFVLVESIIYNNINKNIQFVNNYLHVYNSDIVIILMTTYIILIF